MKLNAEQIASRLEDRSLPVYVFETLDSTSEECRRRVNAGEGRCLVLAEEQTGGRGRSGNGFFSPAGGLYLSLADALPADPVGLTCRAAAETAEAVEALSGISCGIKWVNDLYLAGKKVCGILTEAVGDRMILGVGVNLRPTALPEELKGKAGFLDCGDVREDLAAELVNRLLRPRAREDYMAEYRRRSVVTGRVLECRAGGRRFLATALEIADDGGLVVLGPEGRETLRWGEVTVREK